MLFSILWPSFTSTKSLDRIIRSSIKVLHRLTLYDHKSVNYSLVNSKWLNIYQRSTFSYLKLIVKVLKNHLPSYVNDLLQFRFYRRDLRNSSTYSVITKEELQAIKIWKTFFQCSCSRYIGNSTCTIKN